MGTNLYESHIGLHRYVFLLLEQQQGKLELADEVLKSYDQTPAGRGNAPQTKN